MNDYNFTSLSMITCGALLGVSIGIFAYGSDFYRLCTRRLCCGERNLFDV